MDDTAHTQKSAAHLRCAGTTKTETSELSAGLRRMPLNTYDKN